MAIMDDEVPTCLCAWSFPHHGTVVLTWDNPETVDENVVEMDSGHGWTRLYESTPATKMTIFAPPHLPVRFRIGTRESVAHQKWAWISL